MSAALTWMRCGLRWLCLMSLVSGLVGSAVALFLFLLDVVVGLQWRYTWLLWLLPAGGLLTGWMYNRFGRNCESGANLIYRQIRAAWESTESSGRPDQGWLQVRTLPAPADPPHVPPLMTPLVLVGTLITHLFGGSAGREGTAIQMGGALTSLIAVRIGFHAHETRIMLLAGIAAGFGAVFGTPLAAAVFAVEVVRGPIGRLIAFPVCLACSVLADKVTRGWGIQHTAYQIQAQSLDSLSLWWGGRLVLLGIACGIVCWLFTFWLRSVSAGMQRLVQYNWLRPAVGAGLVLLTVALLQTRSYLGLGVTSIPSETNASSIVASFTESNSVETWSWLWKLLLTGLTLGSGFKGGEATPLFFIGATLGHVVARIVGLPIDLAVGLGFVAVFAAATRTPLACTCMALELFSSGFQVLEALRLIAWSLLVCCLGDWVARVLTLIADRSFHRHPA